MRTKVTGSSSQINPRDLPAHLRPKVIRYHQDTRFIKRWLEKTAAPYDPQPVRAPRRPASTEWTDVRSNRPAVNVDQHRLVQLATLIIAYRPPIRVPRETIRALRRCIRFREDVARYYAGIDPEPKGADGLDGHEYFIVVLRGVLKTLKSSEFEMSRIQETAARKGLETDHNPFECLSSGSLNSSSSSSSSDSESSPAPSNGTEQGYARSVAGIDLVAPPFSPRSRQKELFQGLLKDLRGASERVKSLVLEAVLTLSYQTLSLRFPRRIGVVEWIC
jgi:hypothetical protein